MKKIVSFAFYFTYFAAVAAITPYLVLYYQQLGLSGSEIGILSSISPLIIVFSAPLWTGLADTFHNHRAVMSLTLIAVVLAGILLPVTKSFLLLLILIALYAFFYAPINPFADSATLSMLGNEKNQYGKVRMGGTLGWALAAPAIGFLVQIYGTPAAFYCFSGFMVIGLFISQGLQFPHSTAGQTVKKGIRQLFSNTNFVFFLIIAFFCGIGLTLMNNFLFVYLNDLHATNSMMGFSLTLSTLVEIPVLFFAGKLLHRFGTYRLISVSAFLISLRLLLYSFIQSPELALFSQIMNGFTFPLFWVGAVSYADEKAPPGLSASAQGLLGSVTFGIGAAVGGLIGGLLLEAVGSQSMYRYAGLLLLLSFSIIIPLASHFRKAK